MINLRPILEIVMAAVITSQAAIAAGQELQKRLEAEGAAALVKAARQDGDAGRGAIVFHQAYLGCAKCHDHDRAADQAATPTGLGPDLTKKEGDSSEEEFVNSVLSPSSMITRGYETINIELDDGRSIVGLLAKETDSELVLRNASDGSLVTLAKSAIVERKAGKTSTMPADLINQLSSRQQFLDLIRYLIEIRNGGRDRARELRPAASLIALAIPEYEARIDHAGMLRDLDEKAFNRGKAIYERLCVNCHGTHEQAGSLPTSLRFASDRFKNGSDPFAMYQTLTRGFGLMVPQTWMVPQQKYDVIHYIREAYLRKHNPSQYADISERYLNHLPKGDTRGPAPQTVEPWVTMDYGPTLINTYEIGDNGTNFAHKGIAVRLDPGPGGISRGRAWMVFDHDTLRVAAAWTGSGFIDWNGIHFNGRHQVHPRVVGDVFVANNTGPGWADPETGKFDDDRRILGRDGRRYGPLPRNWGQYRALWHSGDQVVLAYSIGEDSVRESPGIVFLPAQQTGATRGQLPVFTRTFNISGLVEKDLLLLVATHPSADARLETLDKCVRFGAHSNPEKNQPPNDAAVLAGFLGPDQGCEWTTVENRLCLRIPAGSRQLNFAIWFTRENKDWPLDSLIAALPRMDSAPDLRSRLVSRQQRWPQTLTTDVVLGNDEGPFAIDVLTHPVNNPWLAQMRFTGIDFHRDGDSAFVCTWDGDVWLVSGLAQLRSVKSASSGEQKTQLTWRRIASGLFQPLGIKIVDGKIFVTCRDQLVVLHDANLDGETDNYQCFNNDHQVTDHFHEFAMGLQIDSQKNFYYAKSARHALPAVVPHHGTLLRVSADGSKTDILATGFRAANGVCLNPDGTYIVTDQEGHWNPKNRINWVKEGGFYGNMFGYHDVTDTSDAAMQQPLCWITNDFDRSPAELLWIPRETWGPLGGSLLNLSYGNGKLFVVPFEDLNGRKQGGMCQLPLPALPTGVMRGRFHPIDHQLYACGMFAWAGSATQPGGLYRIRYTGRSMYLPTELRARRGELQITFTEAQHLSAADPANYSLKTWSLKRSKEYGSPHFNEQPLAVERATLSDDRRTVTLKLPDIRPTWGMEIACRLKNTDGKPFTRVIHNSVFTLGE